MSYLAKTPEGLLPCPHCGGEAEFETYGGTACAVVCQACHSGTPTMRLEDGERAVELWNRRAERTCHIGMPVIDWETGETDYRCSACGFSADPQDWAETYDCCPRCGSRVVTRDADR